MTGPAPIRGIYFDLWNTLAFTDVSPNPIVALASAFGLYGEPGWRGTMERAIMTRRFTGVSEAIDALAAGTGRALPGGSARAELILAWGRACNRNRLYPDVLPALSVLRRLPARNPLRLGILSNTQSFDLDFMRREGLEAAVDVMCLSFECGLLKPDPRIYLHAAGRMGLPPEQLMMLGDSMREDVQGARESGWRAILLDRAATGAGPERIGSLAELPDLIISSCS
ncbi:MAG TPA: HAD family hydrolase [Candidatus Polarisedimenticolia bacterium]